MTVLLKDAPEAEPRADARGPAGARPLRAFRQHRPRQQLARRRPRSPQARRLRRHRVGLRLGHGDGEVPEHRLPRGGLSPSAVVLVATARGAEAPWRRPRRRPRRDRARLGQPASGTSASSASSGSRRSSRSTASRARRTRRSSSSAAGARVRGARGRAERGVRARGSRCGERSRRRSRTQPTTRTSLSHVSTRCAHRRQDRGDRSRGSRRRRRGLPPDREGQDQAVPEVASTGCRSVWRRRTCPLARPGAHERAHRLRGDGPGLRAYTGAGWLVALCGTMQTMPGLGA